LIVLALRLLQEPIPQQSSNLVDLVLRASPTAKFVLLILLVFSVISWAVILTKARATKRAQRQSIEFLKVFERSSHLQDLYASSSAFPQSPLAAIYIAAHNELRAQLGPASPSSGSLQRMPNLEAIYRTMQSTAISETTRLTP